MKIFFEKGVNDCRIVIPQKAHVVEKTAAFELVNYLEKAFSVSFPIFPESKAEGKCIYVGHTQYAQKYNILGISKENWIIKMHGGNLVLTGGVNTGDRGILYAVYHFLEDILGVRWWNPYEEDVIVLSQLSLPEEFCKEGTPSFPYRKLFMNRPLGEEGITTYPHLPRSRVNVISPLDDAILEGAYNSEVRKYGDVIHMGRPHHCHVLGKLFPKDEVFAEHPEWFAWNKSRGQRIKEGHRCFSNEAFFKALLGKLLCTMEEDVRLSEETGVELPCYYSISPDDLPGTDSFCQCPACEKIIEEKGYGGYVLSFVNRIAREVAKRYPFAKIEHLAYFSFIEPPKDATLPEKNVLVRLANIYVDIFRDIHSVSNRRYLRLLKEWSGICKKAGCELHIWDYMFLMRINYPLPLFYRIKETLKAFEQYGVTGIAVEIEEHYSDMWDLNKYILSHLVENTNLDVEELLYDFTERYYGAAGSCVREYCRLLHEKSVENMAHVYCCLEDSPFNYIDAETALKASTILEQGQKAVGDEAPYCERLKWLRKSLDAVVLFKYRDLEREAAEKEIPFSFDTTSLCTRVTEALTEYSSKPINKLYAAHIPNEIAYFSSLPAEKEELSIPEILKEVDAKDIYQFAFKRLYGFLTVEDKLSASGQVVKLTPRIGSLYGWGLETLPTVKNVQEKKGIIFSLMQNEKKVAELVLYQEDFDKDGYTIYKVGTVENIKKSPDTTLVLFVQGAVSFNLAALAVTFPMDACDVYLAMRAKGEAYGGSKEDEDAVYFDRMIIVRKKVS